MATRLEIVVDYVCVESYLGFTRLRTVVEQLRSEGTHVELDLGPHQLRPDTPFEPEPVFEVHRRDRGEDFARDVRDDRTLGLEDGLEFRFDRALFVNSVRAHQLTALAAAEGRAEAMAERLFRAYFTDGLDIADRPTLHRLAHELDIDASGPWPNVDPEVQRNRQIGVTATPVFRLPRTTLVGARSVAELRAEVADLR